jgi:acetyl-CoA synthetase
MEWERIRKRPEDCVGANLLAYEEYARTFSWAQARALLDGLPGGGLNIAHEAVDRHVLAGRGGRLALRWIGRDNRIRDFSYAALRAQMNRFSNILVQRGITKGDRVFSLPRSPVSSPRPYCSKAMILAPTSSPATLPADT